MTTSGRRRFEIPHVFALLAIIVVVAALATYVVPSGRYERETREVGGQERVVVIPGTYERIEKSYSLRGMLLGEAVEGKATPVGLMGVLTAIPRGLAELSDIVFFIFIVGGVFGILQHSGMITAVLKKLIDLLGHSATWLTIVIMVAIGVGGSTLGMGEEFIPLVPLFLLISDRMGLDRVYGLALVMLAADMGFAAATLNPFTVQVAQGIAGLQPTSGMWLRVVFFFCCMTLTIVYVLRYGARLRRDPSRSVVADLPETLPDDHLEGQSFGGTHLAILVSCVVIFTLVILGMQEYGWYINELAGGFLLMGVVAAAIGRMRINEATAAFVTGAGEMVVAALVVGFAKAIAVVLTDGEVLDTLIYSAATVLSEVPRTASALGMLVFQSTFNFLVPSGSGQAALTMPVMAPLADVLGITRQTAVLAYQFGDGLSNTIVPTSGVLMAMLSLAKVPYTRWLRFVLPLFVQLIVLAGVFLMVAVAIGYK